MSSQYKALRGQLVRTHTPGREAATQDRRREGVHTRSRHGYDEGDVETADDADHVEEFLSSGVIYSLFLYLWVFFYYYFYFPPLQLLCSLALFSLQLFLLNYVSFPFPFLLQSSLHYTVQVKPLGFSAEVETLPSSPRFKEVRGHVCRWDAAPSCGGPRVWCVSYLNVYLYVNT